MLGPPRRALLARGVPAIVCSCPLAGRPAPRCTACPRFLSRCPAPLLLQRDDGGGRGRDVPLHPEPGAQVGARGQALARPGLHLLGPPAGHHRLLPALPAAHQVRRGAGPACTDLQRHGSGCPHICAPACTCSALQLSAPAASRRYGNAQRSSIPQFARDLRPNPPPPPPCSQLGWESIFLGFGSLGFFWLLFWQPMVKEEVEPAGQAGGAAAAAAKPARPLRLQDVPWGAFARSRGFWAIVAAQSTVSVGNVLAFSWLPTFYNQVGAGLCLGRGACRVPGRSRGPQRSNSRAGWTACGPLLRRPSTSPRRPSHAVQPCLPATARFLHTAPLSTLSRPPAARPPPACRCTAWTWPPPPSSPCCPLWPPCWPPTRPGGSPTA